MFFFCFCFLVMYVFLLIEISIAFMSDKKQCTLGIIICQFVFLPTVSL